MKRVTHLLTAIFGFGAIMAMSGAGAGAASATKPKDVCIVAPTGGGGFNTFVLKEVEPLVSGAVVALRGLYFATGQHRISPLHGSAVMGTDGQIRIGFFVHSSAEGQNDFTLSGLVDAGYNGTVGFDNDGDFKPNGTLDMQRVDCATIVLP
jgi:hypothetical protein